MAPLVSFPVFQEFPFRDVAREACTGSADPACTADAEKFIKQNLDQPHKINILAFPHAEMIELDDFDPDGLDKDMNFTGRPGVIDLYEADDFVKKSGYGHATFGGKIGRGVFGAVQRMFYGGSEFDGAHATFGPLVFSIDYFTDGDTAAAVIEIGVGGAKKAFRMRFRLDGIDTPESFRGMMKDGKWSPNPKLEVFKNYIWLLWKKEFGFGDNLDAIARLYDELVAAGGDAVKLEDVWKRMEWAQNGEDLMIKRLLEDRIVYSGLIAGAVTKGLNEYAKGARYSLFPSFNRAIATAIECNEAEFVDIYDRFLGSLYAGEPDEERNLLADFIENELPNIMAEQSSKGRDIYDFFREGKKPAGSDGLPPDENAKRNDDWTRFYPVALTSSGRAYLEHLKEEPKAKEVWGSLAPETLAKPWEVFSKGHCRELASEWREYTKKYPGLKNDIQAMLVFIGVAYAYQKYRNQLMDFYVEAEKGAMNCAHGGGKELHGLNGRDNAFMLMRPDPKVSRLFKEFEKQIGRGRPLTPEDCCRILIKSGGDTYGHCK
jgi:hypothetical protein